MKNIKLWPHVTVAVLGAIILAAGLTYFYLRHEQTAQAEALPNAARIQRVEGEVALNNSPNIEDENAQWISAVPNQPFSVGDRVYTRDNSRASLAFSGRNFARLEPNTALDVVALQDDRTQLALRDGSAVFDVGYLAPGQLFEVATPHGAVDFVQPGLYDVGFDDNGAATISVLSGLAQVVGLGGSGQINKGELLTLVGETAAQVVLSRLNRDDAGYVVDDYYRYQYPNVYDGRYANYDTYLNDPYYYDPYRRSVSYQYVSSYIPGINDLDNYGDWQYVDGSGYAWCPRVDASWSPYQEGQWFNDYPYGLTWVSNEPWGYAPYHYGRWISRDSRWFWIPDGVNTTPRYSPALVAFVPLQNDEIGWVPLGPSDPYVPRYYDPNWQPHYFTRGNLAPTRLVNLNVPGAVTVVSVNQFDRNIDSRVIRRLDPRAFAQVRPTLEPLTFTPLRNAVVHSAWGRGKIDLPPGIARKLDRPVVINGAAPAPPFRRDLARALRLEAVPDRARGQKLQLRDDRNGEVAQPREALRRQRIAQLSAEAARGNRDAGRQAQQLEQQLRRDQLESQRRAADQARQVQQQQRQQQMDARRQAAEQERQVQQQQRALQQQQRQVEQQQRRQQMDAQRASQQQQRQVDQQRRQQVDAQRAAQQQQRQAEQQQRRQQVDAQRAAQQQQRQAQQQQRRAAEQPQGQRVGNPAKQGQRQERQPPANSQGQGGKGKGKKP